MKCNFFGIPSPSIESLPRHCFSCGAIDHDYNNCQSSNRNLKYSTLTLNEIEDVPTSLPHDVVESILTRLPVKSLFRYKLVCKQWEATIFDPKFAEIHLQRYKNSSSQNLLAWEQSFDDYKGLYVTEIQADQFQFVLGIPHARKYRLCSDFLCNYDGLYLKCLDTLHDDGGKMYLLWNPSCRAYREFRSPQEINDGYFYDGIHGRLYGIYYNPLVKDYKVVIADMEHYAVFSCRYNKWSEVEEIKDIPRSYVEYGVPFIGSIYWLIDSESVEDIYNYEIIFFDWKVEKFKKLLMPDGHEKPDWLSLASSDCHLYLCGFDYGEMSIWRKGNDEKDSWMKFKVQFPLDVDISGPICWVNEGKILLGTRFGPYLLYDLSKKTFVEIEKSRETIRGRPVIYRENLFLQ